jgi:hypothetical protein
MKSLPVKVEPFLLSFNVDDAAPYVQKMAYKTTQNDASGKLDITTTYDPARPIVSPLNSSMSK